MIWLVAPGFASAASIAFVIDDVGYSVSRAQQILELPKKVTLSVLPFAPHTTEVLAMAKAQGHEVILHLPMESLSIENRREIGTLTLQMTPEHLDAAFDDALAAVPQLVGVNNHTGSLLTQHRAPMDRLMQRIGTRGLFFLDSRTTHKTVAMRAAALWGVPALQRDVFLDHLPTSHAITSAYRRALAIARRKGYAVVIAHPHPTTLEFLNNTLARLPNDIDVASLAELARTRPVRQPDPVAAALH